MMTLAFVKSLLKSNLIMLLAAITVALGLIIVDLTTRVELNVATIYSLPLILAAATRSRRLLWSLTALLITATFVVYFLQIPTGTFTLHEPFFVNRVLDVVALLLIAWLLHIWMTSMEISETQARLIKEQNEKLEAAMVSRRMVAVQESERRLLANNLHDLIGQKLTALSLNLHIVENQLSPEQVTRISTRLDVSLQLVDETAENIRDVITELRPATLDYGLAPALYWYAEQFTKRTGVAMAVIAQEPVRRLPSAVEEAFFRIAQEALANVVKYARSQKADVTLESTPQSICLTVSDDGCGFVPAANRPPDRNHGWGLVIMRERAATVGAQLSVESAPGQGTKVFVRWRDEAQSDDA